MHWLLQAPTTDETYVVDGFTWSTPNVPVGRIGRSARINVDYAGIWASKRWRFYERGNRYVSVAPRD